MTREYTHQLTETEEACGVSLEEIQEVLPKGLFISDGDKFVLPADTAPALATSTARCAFGGDEVDFLGFNQLGQPVYTRSRTLW